MTHRHEFKGITPVFSLFVAQINSDQTEGKGGMKDYKYFFDHVAAYNSIKGEGVMGHGDGDVALRQWKECFCGEVFVYDEVVYRGTTYGRTTVDGWRPDLSPLLSDPEYKEYMRLHKKFNQ